MPAKSNMDLKKHVFRSYHKSRFPVLHTVQCQGCQCFVPHRGKGVRLKKYCSQCLIKADQANSARYREKYADQCAEARHRRRAAKKTVESESFKLADVIDKWGTPCHICNDSIDMGLKWPHRFSKSMDHVVPISKGGPHKLSNVKLAHLTCNQRKSDKL